jgi:hypothetical protein
MFSSAAFVSAILLLLALLAAAGPVAAETEMPLPAAAALSFVAVAELALASQVMGSEKVSSTWNMGLSAVGSVVTRMNVTSGGRESSTTCMCKEGAEHRKGACAACDCWHGTWQGLE